MQVCGKESGTEIAKGIKAFPLAFAFSRAAPCCNAQAYRELPAQSNWGQVPASLEQPYPGRELVRGADFTQFPHAGTAPAAASPQVSPWAWVSTRSLQPSRHCRHRFLIRAAWDCSADTCPPSPKPAASLAAPPADITLEQLSITRAPGQIRAADLQGKYFPR